MPPGKPQPGKQQEAQEIKIELPGPGQGGHIAKEDRQQVHPVAGNHDGSDADDTDDDDNQKNLKCLHGQNPFNKRPHDIKPLSPIAAQCIHTDNKIHYL